MIGKFLNTRGFQGYIVSGLGTIVLLGLILNFRSVLNPTSVALALLLAVLFSATLYGSRPALLSSLIGISGFNFLFLPPYYTFSIAEPKNWLAFAAFLITALTAGQMSSYAKKRAEESEERRREIKRLYDELQTAFEQASQTEALKQSEKLKSALLDAVTHDLRTPLTSIKAAVTTLLEDKREKILDLDAEEEFLEIIDEETDRLNNFIEAMVGLARIEANALEIRKKQSTAEEIVNNAIERAKIRTEAHRILFEPKQSLPEIFIDAVSVSEVLYILLENAAKYSEKNTSIRVSCRILPGGDFIEFAVEDEGGGIRPDLREKVFSKFYRKEETDVHTTSSGLGLGLAIARGIVESQKGKIRVEDGADGFVTKFVFTIKISED